MPAPAFIRCVLPARSPSALGRLAPWLALVCLWALLGSGRAAAQTAYPPLVLEVSANTRYQMRAEPRTGEVMIRILGGGQNIPEQVAQWHHPLLLGAVAVPRGGGEIVIRMRMRWRVTVYGALKQGPPRLILGLGEPVAGVAGVYSKSAVDFMASSSDKAPVIAEPKPVTLEGRARGALLLPDLPPEGGPPPEHSLAMGSRVIYTIPQPPFPAALGRWSHTYATPLNVSRGADKEVKQLWALARAGEYEAALNRADELLHQQQQLMWREEIVYLQAGLCYELANHPNMPELTPMERARLAYNLDPDHPQADRTLYIQAISYMNLGFYHEASKLFLDLLFELPENDPHRPDVLLALGRADHLRGKPDQAIDSLMEALETIDQERRHIVLMAMAAAELDNNNGRAGLSLLELARELEPRWQHDRYFRHLWAEALYRTNRFQAAREAYTELSAEERGGPLEAWMQLRIGECILMQQDFQAAAEFFTRDVDVRPLGKLDRSLVLTLWKLRGVQLRMMRQDTRLAHPLLSLLERLRLEIPLRPVEPEVLFELGKYYHRAGDVQAAVTYFAELFARYPDFPFRKTAIQLVWRGFKEKVEAMYAAGDSFGVAALYEQFLPVLDTESAGEVHTFFLIAHSYVRLSLYEEAYTALAPAFFLADSDGEARSQAALMTSTLQRMRGYPADALPAVDLIRKRSEDEDLLLRATLEEARARDAMGEHDAALALYDRFTQEAFDMPDVPGARLAQGRLHLEKGEHAAAAQAFEAGIAAADTLLPPEPEAAAEGSESGAQGADGGPSEGAKAPWAAARRSEAPTDGSDWATWYLPTEDDIRRSRVDALYLLGEAAMGHGDSASAIAALERGLKLAPEHPSVPWANYTLGRALLAAGRADEAYERWQTFTADPRYADNPFSALASQMLAQTRWEESALGGPVAPQSP